MRNKCNINISISLQGGICWAFTIRLLSWWGMTLGLVLQNAGLDEGRFPMNTVRSANTTPPRRSPKRRQISCLSSRGKWRVWGFFREMQDAITAKRKIPCQKPWECRSSLAGLRLALGTAISCLLPEIEVPYSLTH